MLLDETELSDRVSDEGNNSVVDAEGAGDYVSLMVTTRAPSHSDPEEDPSSSESSASMAEEELILAGQTYGRPSEFDDSGVDYYARIAKCPLFHRAAVLADAINQFEQLRSYADEDDKFN